MKNPVKAILVLVSALVMTSCGVGSALVLNQNQNATQVQLGSNNFRTVQTVSGNAQVQYICLIGGLSQKTLYQNAYSDMMKKAELTGSRAVVNIVTEEHVGGVPPFYFKRTITVSGQVIEFSR